MVLQTLFHVSNCLIFKPSDGAKISVHMSQ